MKEYRQAEGQESCQNCSLRIACTNKCKVRGDIELNMWCPKWFGRVEHKPEVIHELLRLREVK